MADRRIITLNPLGFNENLQSSDRLLVESPSSFKSADFTEDITFPNATASGNITINGTPSAPKHAVTVELLNNAVSDLEDYVDQIDIETTLPLTDSKNGKTFILDINSATEIAEGVIRIATQSDVDGGTATDCAVTPAQLFAQLGGIVIVDASTTEKGIIKLATNQEVFDGLVDDEAVTPASMRYALDQANYLLDGGSY